MKRSYFVPDSWNPREKDIEWCVKEFKVSTDEALRQVTLMRDYEFKRGYSDWNRVLRNWYRKAEQLGTFERERVMRKPAEYTEEERKADAAKAWAEMNRLRGVK